MVVDAFVLPLPGKSLGVVFWDRLRRAGGPATGASGLAVYAPDALSPGELVELRASLVTSIGEALTQRAAVSRPLLVLWWLLGALVTAVFALQVLQLDLGLGFLAAIAFGASLPWGTARLAFGTARRRALARAFSRHLSDLPAASGADPRSAERLSALWQFARRQRGSVRDQLQALEQFCLEQAWPAAAQVYADRQSGSETEPLGGVAGLVRLRPGGRSAALYAATELRAWP